MLSFIENIYLLRRSPLNDDKIINIRNSIFLKNVITREIYRFLNALRFAVKKRYSVVMGIYTTNHIIMAYYISKIFRIKLISNIIGDEFSESKKINKHLKYVLASDIIIVRGRASKKFFVNYGFPEGRIYIVPNYFDVNSIPINNIVDKEYDLIFTGNFTNIKRLDILVEAVHFVKVRYNYNKIKVLLIGNGILKDKIIKQVKKLDLYNNIRVLDYTEDNINEFYCKSRAFIMTSEFEGLPMSMIEALSCGLPVIMPRVSNIPDYAIDGYNALLVEPLDVEGFADAIYKLITDEELYNKLKSGAEKFREEHKDEFSMENITKIWNDVFSLLMK